ncbi:MAG: ribosomal protein S18-alanine N-acetyltransferase [Defluviitaleaceae bacterium]|nr:ribosomal protein S18-alanine N-acetyltransferase [Defluviitaleaceae bacterium]
MITTTRMEERHLAQVCEIEDECFAIAWSREALEHELRGNKLAVYFVACDDDEPPGNEVLGYAGMWHVVNEGHITNVAVRERYRRMGVGDALVKALVAEAETRGMIGLTLEVSVANIRAQKLYIKHGFKPEGFRKDYYDDTHEDAIIMWKYFNTDTEVT